MALESLLSTAWSVRGCDDEDVCYREYAHVPVPRGYAQERFHPRERAHVFLSCVFPPSYLRERTALPDHRCLNVKNDGSVFQYCLLVGDILP